MAKTPWNFILYLLVANGLISVGVIYFLKRILYPKIQRCFDDHAKHLRICKENIDPWALTSKYSDSGTIENEASLSKENIQALGSDINSAFQKLYERAERLSIQLENYVSEKREETEDATMELRSTLLKLSNYTSPSFASSGGLHTRHVYDSVQTLKSELRRVKGLLLNRNNFPAASLAKPPQYVR